MLGFPFPREFNADFGSPWNTHNKFANKLLQSSVWTSFDHLSLHWSQFQDYLHSFSILDKIHHWGLPYLKFILRTFLQQSVLTIRFDCLVSQSISYTNGVYFHSCHLWHLFYLCHETILLLCPSLLVDFKILNSKVWFQTGISQWNSQFKIFLSTLSRPFIPPLTLQSSIHWVRPM